MDIPNDALYYARREKNWTQQRVAEELCHVCETMTGKGANVDAKMVAKWEKGKHTPSLFYQEKLCILYNRKSKELGFEEQNLKRRTAIKAIGGVAIAGMALFTERSIPAYQSVLPLTWKEYYSSNVYQAIETVNDWIAHLEPVIQQISGKEKTQLQTLLCQYHQLAGVITRDHGDFELSFQHSEKAYALASLLENPELITSTLNRRARLWKEMQMPGFARADIEQAFHHANQTQDPLHYYTSLCFAESLADIGKDTKQQSLKLLDQVEAKVRAKNILENDGSYMKVDVPGYFMMKADILRKYGEFKEAGQALGIIQEDMKKHLPTRWKGNLLVSQAQLEQAKGNSDGACMLALSALPIIHQTGSKANLRKVQDLQKSMPQNQKQVAQLQEAIQVYPGGHK